MLSIWQEADNATQSLWFANPNKLIPIKTQHLGVEMEDLLLLRLIEAAEVVRSVNWVTPLTVKMMTGLCPACIVIPSSQNSRTREVYQTPG